MFESMMKLVEQQNADGAVRHPEFDPPLPSGRSPSDEGREALIAFIDASTPDRHKYRSASGHSVVVYFDARGRAVSGELRSLDDDTLRWIAQSKDMRGNPLPKSDPGYTPPVQESVGFTLTPKSRTAIEKLVYGKFPPDSKMKQGGRLKVMFTGESAKAAGVQSYTTLFLDQVECAALVDVARLVAGGAVESLIAKTETAPILADDRDALVERHGGPVKRSRDAMDPTIEIYSVSSKDMSREDFEKWVKAKGITSKIEKRSDGWAVVVESAGSPMRTFKLGTFMNLKTQTLDAWFYPMEDQKNGGLAGLQVDIGDSGRPGKAVKKSVPSSHRSAWKEGSPPDAVRAKFEAHPDFQKE